MTSMKSSVQQASDKSKKAAPALYKTASKKEKLPEAFVSVLLAPSKRSHTSIFNLVSKGLWDQTTQVREGLPAVYVAEMSDALAMPRASYLDNLHLPRSTIEARIKNKTPLTSSEGSAVLRSAKALARAEQIFEDRAAAATWFKREIRALGGVTPVSLMDTDSGFELVMKTLGRIEQGVVA
jgi:putative toxin-antitoxin system antitoxin component (TIGR02293 family)